MNDKRPVVNLPGPLHEVTSGGSARAPSHTLVSKVANLR